ncbi:MAG: DEAD/DEAH box helicase [Crocosphaera sp.]
MVNVIRGTSDKPASSKKLGEYFEARDDIEGTLYLGYPIIGTAQGGYQIDALLVSKQHGVIIFHIVEGTHTDLNLEDIQDENITKLESKLLQHKELLKKRKLMVEMSVVTYAPAWHQYPEDIDTKEYPILIDYKDLGNFIQKCSWENNQCFEKVNSVIQAITTISKKNPRSYVNRENSRGAKLKKIEESIANLDATQNAAVLETVEGVQRIRGLAGSGKTIVLALKVAYLHAKRPDWNIAVTFNTRSLKGQFKKLINNFTIEHTNEEPDWEKISIIHAWGSPKIEGIYYNFCKIHNIEYLDFSKASSLTFEYGKEFDYACEKALHNSQNIQQYYDVILVDEAQDFSKYFLRLCYEILKDPKRLVYAYDELQSLSDKMMQSPELLFGNNEDGEPKVRLENVSGEPKQDVVLNTCYRNSRPILASAHALGFGIYRDQGLVQMFDESQLWLDIGYDIAEGELKEGEFVKLIRTNETSPPFLASHSDIDDLIMFKTFNNNQEQIDWLVKEIENNLKNDELRYDDIMVIHTNPQNTNTAVGKARELLFERNINSNLAGVTTTPDVFFEDNAIVFTGIYRAKGNEAAMIYVINAQQCFRGSELDKKRNILFTAMTRSKAWIRVLGYGPNMKKLEEEFKKIKVKDFSLNFTYPTEEERSKMKLVNRDISQAEKKNKEKQKREVIKAIKTLDEGNISVDDLPKDIQETLKNLQLESNKDK